MNFQNEHADRKETSQQSPRLPVEAYAASLDPQIVREDVRFAERQAEQGIPQLESVRNLTGEHIRHTEGDQSTISLAEKYANRVTELVRMEREQPIEKILESLQPSPVQMLHWEPAIGAIGAAQTDSLLWRREHGDIQSYQQIAEPKGWLHIDSAGQFFDRGARMISPEQATAPLGISIPESVGNNQSKDLSNSSGLGVSL